VSSEIRATRQRLKLSQADFARLLGVSAPYVSRLENDRVVPTTYVAMLLNAFTSASRNPDVVEIVRQTKFLDPIAAITALLVHR